MPPPKGSKKKSPKKIKIPIAVQNAVVKRLRKPDVRNIILKHGLNRSSENKIAQRLESPLNLSKLSNTIIAEQKLEQKIKLSDQRFKMVERGVKLSLLVAIPVMIALFVNKLKKDVGVYLNNKVSKFGNQLENIKQKGEKFIESSEVRNDFKKGMKEFAQFQLPNIIRKKPPPPPKQSWRNWALGKPKPPPSSPTTPKNNRGPSSNPSNISFNHFNF